MSGSSRSSSAGNSDACIKHERPVRVIDVHVCMSDETSMAVRQSAWPRCEQWVPTGSNKKKRSADG